MGRNARFAGTALCAVCAASLLVLQAAWGQQRETRRGRPGPQDAVDTVATDGAAMYLTEVDKVLARDFAGGFGPTEAAETFGRYVLGAGTDDLLELTPADREDLAAAIASVPADSWVAGCLWEQRDRTDIVRVVHEPDGVAEPWSARTRSGREMSLLTVDGVSRPAEFSEIAGPGYYCNVPRE